MRRHIGILCMTCFMLVASYPVGVSAKPIEDLAPSARSAILMDADSGTIIYEKHSHEKLPPASMTKIVTMLLGMEAIAAKKISLTDQVSVSEYAASMGGSQIFLEQGEKISVNDLFKGIAISSGNDASIALAEHVAGSTSAFVAMMNDKVKQLGLKDTYFSNPNGLNPSELTAQKHYSSAYDMAYLSRELLLNYPQITKYTGTYQDYLRKDTKKQFWLVNTNRMVRFYEGSDGLKTGFTQESGYCLSSTAKRGSFRVIAVVMGEPNVKTRNKEVAKMLDYAFSNYTNHPIYRKGDLIAVKEIDKGEPRKIEIKANHPLSILVKKGDNPSAYQRKVILRNLTAPIKKGDILGKVLFQKDGRIISQLTLSSNKDIAEASLWSMIKQVVNDTLFVENK